MKKLLPFILAGALFASCSSAKKSQAGTVSSAGLTSSTTSSSTATEPTAVKDGSGYEKAIVIKAKNELEGVNAEYKWLKENYPGYTRLSQSLSSQGKRHYDILKIKTKDGEQKSIYFDITDFFGKF